MAYSYYEQPQKKAPLPGSTRQVRAGKASASECGADVLKVFPGDIAGPAFIKDIHGPIPNAVMMPSGGVDVDNVKDWIKAGAIACGAGSSLIAGAKTGDYDKITETGKLFVQRIKEARAEMAK